MTCSADASELNLINLPKAYGGSCRFDIGIEAGPWQPIQPIYSQSSEEESKDKFEMQEDDEDQIDLLNEGRGFDMGNLRDQLKMGKI